MGMYIYMFLRWNDPQFVLCRLLTNEHRLNLNLLCGRGFKWEARGMAHWSWCLNLMMMGKGWCRVQVEDYIRRWTIWKNVIKGVGQIFSSTDSFRYTI